ncbi:MAG: cobT 1 [Firmicutes bacterium]|nr:cobT 1 [Bacillota bacterium]
MDTIAELLKEIEPIDAEAASAVQKRFDCLIKPLGSLGLLEEITARIFGARRSTDIFLLHQTLIHIVGAQGGPAPSFLPGARLTTVSLPLPREGVENGSLVREAIRQGAEEALRQIRRGTQVLAISQAVVEENHTRTLARDLLAGKEEAQDDIFRLLDCREYHAVAVMLGVILAGAANRVPVVLDGLATACAALIACRLNPDIKSYLIGVHLAPYPEHGAIFTTLGWKPGLPLNLSASGGVGAILTLSLLDAGIKALVEMGTFAGAGVSSALQDLPEAVQQDYC